jgi:hypothetical protein
VPAVEEIMAKNPASPSRPAAVPAGSKPFVSEPQVAANVGAHDVHGAPVVETGPNSISRGMDYAAHESMYHKFTGLVKWGIIIAVVVVIFLFVVIHPMVPTAAS